MGVETALHDESLSNGKLRDLAVFATMTTEAKPDLGNRRVVRGLEIFRAGKFKDSRGVQREWEMQDLHIMADNFATLRSSGTFPNVPVRTDHSTSVSSIVGYIEALTVVGDRLVADVEFTEPDHFAKFDRGTYRSRSIEIAKYESNDGNEFWPTVMGLAFVDIPAIEGLHRKSGSVGLFQYAEGEKEPVVPEKIDPPQPFTFRIGGQEETDYGKVQAHLATIEGENAALKTRNETLETFAKEQKVAGRHTFVTSLAADKKVAATQLDAMKVLVETMTDEQFEAFVKAYEGAPVMSLLGNHAEGTSNPAGEPLEELNERQVAEEIVAMHRRANMSEDEIAKTASYRKLTALNGQK